MHQLRRLYFPIKCIEKPGYCPAGNKPGGKKAITFVVISKAYFGIWLNHRAISKRGTVLYILDKGEKMCHGV